jgi:hypothetical protein
MSSARVKTFKRELNYTAVFTAPSTVTFTTPTAHYLVTGNLVDIISLAGTTQLPNTTVTVIDATNFSISSLTDTYWKSGKVVIKYFSTGMTGLQVITSPRNQTGSSVIQSFVTGTGTAVYTLSGSLDGIHWTPLATVTHAATSGDTQNVIVEPSWAYLGVNITSIGAATTLAILYSA